AITQKINGIYSISHQTGNIEDSISQNAILWAANNGKMAGPGTDNWPELTNWIIPFERLPTSSPVLLIADAKQTEGYLADDFRVMADQLCNAYQRSINIERARQAELLAREESVHNTLLASISHDMRTPLTGIIGAAGTLLHQQYNLSSEATMLLESILSEAEQLAASTENILSLVHLESKQNEPIELDWQSPEEIVGMLMRRYRDRGLEHKIETEVMDNTSLIKGHATLLTQALFNLIENALNVQPEGVPVILRVQLNHHKLEISVLDEGPGFPEGFNSKNIAKFTTYKNIKKRGFGLGLAIAHAVAQKHQAALIIGKREPVGSSVTLSFSTTSVASQNE
ncbi:MAG: ATP-binding protein, partial [Nitrosomonadales bacterium]|nr:ATP-binding protein [Nitrosomonadales bacterium]